VRSSRAFLANPTWLDPEVEAAPGYMALGRGVEARCASPQQTESDACDKEMLDDLTNLAKQKYVAPYFFAGVYIGLGSRD
jgi:hypothetical protein